MTLIFFSVVAFFSFFLGLILIVVLFSMSRFSGWSSLNLTSEFVALLHTLYESSFWQPIILQHLSAALLSLGSALQGSEELSSETAAKIMAALGTVRVGFRVSVYRHDGDGWLDPKLL